MKQCAETLPLLSKSSGNVNNSSQSEEETNAAQADASACMAEAKDAANKAQQLREKA